MSAFLFHGYINLPGTALGWEQVVAPCKAAYWKARSEGRNENEALCEALNVMAGDHENHRHQ